MKLLSDAVADETALGVSVVRRYAMELEKAGVGATALSRVWIRQSGKAGGQ